MKGNFLKKMLALGLAAALLVGNIAPAYAVEPSNETVEVSAPSLSMAMEDGVFTEYMEVTNHDDSATSVYYGIATKEEIEAGIEFDNSCYVEPYETVHINVTDYLHARIAEPGEFYFVSYTEDDEGAVSAITAVEDYTITITQVAAEESAVYKTGNLSGYEYFVDKFSDAYKYADLMLSLTDDWDNVTTIISRLENEKGMYYFDNIIYDSWYDNWSMNKLILWDVTFGETDCVVEQTIYSTLEDGGDYSEPRADVPSLTLVEEKGVIDAIEFKNNDATDGTIWYGLATKEQIESGEDCCETGYGVESSETLSMTIGGMIREKALKQGTYYCVAYVSNEEEADSELVVLEDYPFTVTETISEDRAVYQPGSVSGFNFFTGLSVDKYDEGVVTLSVTDEYGDSWNPSENLSSRNGMFGFGSYDGYTSWSAEELLLWKNTVTSSGCTVEQTRFTNIVEGDVYVEAQAEKPAM